MKGSIKMYSLPGKTGRLLGWRPLYYLVILLACAAVAACSAWHAQRIPSESAEWPVLFTFEGTAQKVCLSGDFNAWSPDSHCLTKEGRKWKIQVFLPSGRYKYGFLLDGKRWVPDSGALLQEEDGFGRMNSVLVVE
jgi:1,4-alpha-glucan branching enzyme